MEHPSRHDVERQLRLMLGASEFQAAPKLSELLLYLVTQTLAGNADRLKGYSIGLDVFDREPGFDQGGDAIVRVQMGRLRKLMAEYYAGSGVNDPIRIRLKKGNYVPGFELASGEVLEDLAPPPPPPLASEAAARDARSLADAPQPPPVGGWRRRIWPAIATALALVLLSLAGWQGWRMWSASRDAVLDTPKGPLVYVTQYRTIGTSPLAQRLSEGLQFELVTQISKFPDLGVLGFDTVHGATPSAARNQPLGADFVLGGAVEMSGGTVQITSHLTRVRDGVVIWTDQARADSVAPVTIVKVQNEIAMAVASQLGQPYGVVPEAMKYEIAASEGTSLEQYECVLDAYAYMREKTPAGHAQVRDCLEKAVAKSPNYSTAWALLSWAYGDEERYGINRRAGAAPPYVRALDAAERAVAANPTNAIAYEYLSIAKFQMGNDDAGMREAAETALRLNPNNSDILADAGWNYALTEGNDRSRDLIRKAIALNPGHPSWYWGGLAIHALQNGIRDDALKFARLNINDHGPMDMFLLAAALRLNGRGSEADAALAQLAKTHPFAISRRAETIRALRIPPRIEALIFGNSRP